MAVKWLDDPEDHDYDAAADYLTMLASKDEVAKVVAALKTAKTTTRKAKDILRAAQLPLLPAWVVLPVAVKDPKVVSKFPEESNLTR